MIRPTCSDALVSQICGEKTEHGNKGQIQLQQCIVKGSFTYTAWMFASVLLRLRGKKTLTRLRCGTHGVFSYLLIEI